MYFFQGNFYDFIEMQVGLLLDAHFLYGPLTVFLLLKNNSMISKDDSKQI